MPYVEVIFDSAKVDQLLVDRLKAFLPRAVAEALNYSSGSEKRVLPDSVYVGQRMTHTTDQNPPVLEIFVRASWARWRSEGRDEFNVRSVLASRIQSSNILPDGLWEGGTGHHPYVWVVLFEHSSGGPVPAPRSDLDP